jgi:hypothetical protein
MVPEHDTDTDTQTQERSDDVQRVKPEDAIETWKDIQDDSDHPDTTATLAPLLNATAQDWLGSNQDPDVLLAVPNLGIDHIGLSVDNVRAHVELHAKVLDLLELHVGADVSIDKVELEIDNVRVQAMLKVKLEKVVDIVGRVMDTIDANPEILTNLTAGVGKGLENALAPRGEKGDDGGWDQSPELSNSNGANAPKAPKQVGDSEQDPDDHTEDEA